MLAQQQLKAARAAEVTARAQASAGDETQKAAAKVNAAGAGAKRSSRGFGDLSGSMRKAANVAKFAAVAAAAAAAAFAVVAVPVLKTGMEFESLQSRLDNLLQSSEAGAKAFKFIQGFAAKTPFSLQQVTKAFIDLTTRGVDPTAARLTGLGDLASSFGGDLQSITDAISAAARGELDPLEKYGLSAKTAGDKIIVSFKGQKFAVEKNAEAITDLLTKFGQYPGIAGAMEAQSKTLAGQLSNAQDSLSQFLNTAAQSGPLERTGEILALLQEKFINPRNAQLLGQALDKIFTLMRNALKDLDPQDVTDGFELLVNVMELVARALQPLIWLWKALVGMLDSAVEVTDRVLAALDAIGKALLITTPLSDGIRGIGEAFGFLNAEAEETGAVLDGLRVKAQAALAAIKRAVTGAIAGTLTDEELAQVAENQSLPQAARDAAKKEQDRRSSEQADKKEKQRQKDEQRFDPSAPLDKAAQGVGEEASQKEFKRLLDAGMPEDAAKKQASLVGVEAEQQERKRLGSGGKIRKKGKKKEEDVFFDFEKEASSAARSQSEKFAGEELQRLVQEGITFEEALAQSREAGKKREEELKQKFLAAGKVFDASANNILDVLGLRGPGSVLEGRPPPQNLMIAPQIHITMIDTFNQTIGELAGRDALAEVTGAAGKAAAEAGLGDLATRVQDLFDKMMDLRIGQLLKADAGGRVSPGPEG
jgi:hypothetical protein